MPIAARTDDVQTVAAQGIEMLAAGDKNELMSGRSQLRSEIAAHGARADDRDTHEFDAVIAVTLFSGVGDVNLTAV